MTHRQLVLIAAAGSAALLLGAFAFQLAGYAPCELCLLQRWPHAAAIVIGALALVLGWRWLAWPGALAALTTAAIGVYHSGVERHLWAGPSSCTGGGVGLSGDLLSTDAPRLIMCDQISWQIFGISMANWNVIFSLILFAVWIAAARRR
ncbi:MAG: disulfide bond formation protein B [Limimaricola sp.]|uniref:disulfide bond formation protein B n=1 Tax=Limimaricola sp. TaxID=2211665 RepID=UPI001E1AC5EE|nr:disulfide bond formation protein B [Limimaricola sp.]MBI1418039.1 disulfide bond formation protein B [Limimaricola sp.]